MRNSRQQEIAVAKQREEAVRLAERAKTGETRNRASYRLQTALELAESR